eukprot:TRINITY_DN1062_c0_g1_i3.p2 TRINITY_DN1062_c0_g1~~TRINITY_DN1062_c0_g1_i3.p2  ORF type:complete len:123 (-),score=11.73 TRINITY_DN1062_c0_g1_i3:546-914(-)
MSRGLPCQRWRHHGRPMASPSLPLPTRMQSPPHRMSMETWTHHSPMYSAVSTQSTWGCDVSKFPWTYDEAETAYVLEGEVTVTPSDGRDAATFGKGDLVTFPQGMQCVWDVKKAISKHYRFG